MSRARKGGKKSKSFLKSFQRGFRRGRRAITGIAKNRAFDEIADIHPETAQYIKKARKQADNVDRVLTPLGLGAASRCGAGKIKR